MTMVMQSVKFPPSSSMQRSVSRCMDSRILLSLLLFSALAVKTSGEFKALRGGSSATMTFRPELRKTYSSTIQKQDAEDLERHKALLRVPSRPSVLGQADRVSSSSEKPRRLQLIRPDMESNENCEGKVREIEDTKKFKAFQGTGHVMLSPEEVKSASSTEMHKLAIARLARMQIKITGGSNLTVSKDSELIREEEARFKRTHMTAVKSVNVQPPAEQLEDVKEAMEQTARQTISGEKEGVDEHGNTWKEIWGVDEATGKRFGSKVGYDGQGEWHEEWTLSKDGQFELTGGNTQGHRWGQSYGIFENGTSWREKWLEKWEFAERTKWTSDGTTEGSRRGRDENDKTWEETWGQSLADGIEKGHLSGRNEYGETWEEEWETAPLNAFDAETGLQKQTSCGQKSGVDRSGMRWSETWGKDDIYGRWGTRSEERVDGSSWTEHWGANFEGDLWCEKWGVNKLGLGVSEEWGWKCGQKNVRIGQEMDGVKNEEEGKVETWTETWCKTFEADGRLARTHAEKHGDNGFGDKWVEKWDELYDKTGATEKWASKRGSKERTNDVWHEQWGEKRAPPDEHNPNGRFSSCWAEKEGTNGYGERWHDQWSENYEDNGSGNKVCNKWKVFGDGTERIERSGEEWDGRGWFQKGGETLLNGAKVTLRSPGGGEEEARRDWKTSEPPLTG